MCACLKIGSVCLRLFKIFQHPPKAEEIRDPAEVKKQYRYWRWRIFCSMYAGYVFFYLTRKSFTFAMPAMMVDLGFTKTDLGILGSVLYITYGLSKFVSGVMSDRSNPRYFMSVGLILTGVFNIFFGMSSSICFFAIFWGLNGWFQGWGWPPCARLLTHWYSQEERGTWWGIGSTSHNVGGALIPIIVALIIQAFGGWREAMYFPGAWCIVMGFVLMNRLRDTPQSLGLPSIERYSNSANTTITAQDVEEEKELSRKELLVDYVLRNKYIWMLGFAYFFVYILRTAINDWGQLYLFEVKHFSLIAASVCIFSFEAGGFLGTLAAGFLSDKLFAGRRGPINAIFCLFAIFAIASLWFIPAGQLVIAATAMFLAGFLIFGPQMLIGLAAAELSHKKAAGTATGFIGWFAYSGAAAAGFPFGKITQDFGWQVSFGLLALCSVIALFLLLPLWGAKKREIKVGSVAKAKESIV